MRKKLTFILALFTSLPLLLFSVFSISSSEQELRTNAYQISLNNVKAVQNEISMLINLNFDLLKVLAQNNVFHANEVNTNLAKPLLVASANAHPGTILSYVDSTGLQRVRSDDLPLVNLSDRDYLKQATETGKPVVSNILVNKANGHNIVVLCIPILNEKQKVTGSLHNVIDLSSISDYVTKLSNDENTAYILDQSGKVLAHPDDAYLQKDLSGMSYVQQGLQGHNGTDVITVNGKKLMISYIYDTQTGWVIGNEQAYDSVMSQSMKTRIKSIWILAITLVLAVIVGYYFSNRIAKPIIQLTDLTKEAANGDLTIQISIQDKNEIGQLANSFNTMVRNLRQIIQQVRSSSENVAASAVELTSSASQTSKATKQVALIIEEVATETEKQVQTLEESSRSVHEISASIQQIAANAQTVSSVATQTAEKTEQGNLAIQAAIQQMNSIHQTINGLAEVIKLLSERSQEIEQIVGAITDIASQTNLLALNAAIEAARAGEHGRGFAVVAGEVRKLAEQSSSSAQNIVQLITVIRSEITRTVQSVDLGIQDVATGLNAVNTAGEAFALIQHSIHAVTSQIQEVSVSSHQMSANTLQVVQSFKTILQVSNITASGTQNISAAAEEQLATMEEIASSVHLLSKMASELQTLIGKFKI
ncbi:MAG: hypothetical protein K0Q73_3798 [Paenibacillus sp.]|nr:hypothetical protein [Paenibacillus sp.]